MTPHACLSPTTHRVPERTDSAFCAHVSGDARKHTAHIGLKLYEIYRNILTIQRTALAKNLWRMDCNGQNGLHVSESLLQVTDNACFALLRKACPKVIEPVIGYGTLGSRIRRHRCLCILFCNDCLGTPDVRPRLF